MRITTIFIGTVMLAACGGGATGSQFSVDPEGFIVPNNGGNPEWGFWTTGEVNASENGQENYSLIDMNGDEKPDLVVMSKTEATTVKSFPTEKGRAWKVYINDDGGFEKSPRAWALPNGGHKEWGFWNTSGGSLLEAGHELWFLADLTGDKKPDLVVTAESTDSNEPKTFNVDGGPAWKVYENTGSGFEAEPRVWRVPEGGNPKWGFWLPGETDVNTDGQENYLLADLTGDNRPDLVVTSRTRGQEDTFVEVPLINGGPAWKVYRNTGKGFETSASVWTVPEGGNPQWGFWTFGEDGGSKGQELYGVTDINGDNKPDLVVTATQREDFVETFSDSVGRAWKVYYSTGKGFERQAKLWSIPAGGDPEWGFYTFSDISTGEDGQDNYGAFDINGDDIMDLVISSEVRGNDVSGFTNIEGQKVWRVYLGEEGGFSKEPSTWAIPTGGNPEWGFWTFSEQSTASSGQDNYGLIDMNGDGVLDLLVTSKVENDAPRLVGGGWKVYYAQ